MWRSLSSDFAWRKSNMSESQIIEADLVWTGTSFERDVRIAVNEDGVIASVGKVDGATTRRLERKALLPGFVNAHSHAFQRGLRGLGETFPKGEGSFWTWREAMYDLVERIDAETIYELSKQAFSEMLACGITTVGEFHYLHHDQSKAGYTFDEVVLKAAADAGIRIALLNVFYKTGGIRKPLGRGQDRFATPSLEAYWDQMDMLAELIDPATQSLGVVAHSIRAVPLDDLVALHEEACKRGMVFHMHVEEQPQEIEVCIEVYHKPPMALLNERLEISPFFTAVHCTHTADKDMDEFLASGGNVCICPLTEANLGDGLANVPRLLRNDGRICLGTDSNSRLCFTEEMRLLEYGQRLRLQKRGVCVDGQGNAGTKLLEMATSNGARSLGLKVGKIAKGHHADFATIDLDAAALKGWTETTLLDTLILGTGNEAIAETCVGGS